ncbi:hypothetical protein MJD09_01405, partial [bacterium]|nr:hypothetical protein [bacterium]
SIRCPKKSGKEKAVKIRYLSDMQANGMLEAKKAYKMALKECLRKRLSCTGVQQCLTVALGDLQDQVDACAKLTGPDTM